MRASHWSQKPSRVLLKSMLSYEYLPDIKLITARFVHQYEEEYNEIKKERRAGRPASTREDVLKLKISQDEREWETGFCKSADPGDHCFVLTVFIVLPDLTDADNVIFLDRWDGTWSYLPTLKWVRICKDGTVKSSSFPPKGRS
jgi:translation machinery-associated protein 16